MNRCRPGIGGRLVGKPLLCHQYVVNSIALGTLEGRIVVISGGEDGTLRIWDLASHAQREDPLRGHDQAVFSVVLGTLNYRPVIVSVGRDDTVRTWDLCDACGGIVQRRIIYGKGAKILSASPHKLAVQWPLPYTLASTQFKITKESGSH